MHGDDEYSKWIATQFHVNINIASLGTFLGKINMNKMVVERNFELFCEKEDIWYIYWKDQTRVNLKQFCKDNITNTIFKESFSTYMFMVILLLSIVPQNKPIFPMTESLTYAQDLANASQLFRDLANG
jgi:hypothetical protein